MTGTEKHEAKCSTYGGIEDELNLIANRRHYGARVVYKPSIPNVDIDYFPEYCSDEQRTRQN
jgi:hypothetical protein